jgi:hypothetical protein
MPNFICMACGTQYSDSAAPPAQCVICVEERQYVPPRGQGWTTLEALCQGHFNSYREYEPSVIGIGAQPPFAIGQRALLVRTRDGNVLWDCIATIDAAAVTVIEGLGGIDAIAVGRRCSPRLPQLLPLRARARRAPPAARAVLVADSFLLNPLRAVLRSAAVIAHPDGLRYGLGRPRFPQAANLSGSR